MREGCRAGTYRNVTQDGQQDVDEEVGIASTLEEDTQRREEDGEDDLEDVAAHPLANDLSLPQHVEYVELTLL